MTTFSYFALDLLSQVYDNNKKLDSEYVREGAADARVRLAKLYSSKE